MNGTRLRAVRLLIVVGLALVVGGIVTVARPRAVAAVSGYLTQARAQYPNIKGSALDSCALCHPAGGYALNSYAQDYANNGHSYTAIQNLDSDGDGFTNLQEINALTFPGDSASHPGAAATATPTRTAVPPTTTPTRTPAPGATATPPQSTPVPSTNRIAFLGVVTHTPDHRIGEWRIGGRTVYTTSSTWIEQAQLLGENGEGSQVWVLGTRQSNGSVSATYMRVLTASHDDGDDD